MMVALVCALLLCASAPARAQELDLEEEEGAGPQGPRRMTVEAWPAETRLDRAAQLVTLVWPTEPEPRLELVALDEAIRFERARPYEGMPDELFLLLADGRRVLVSRGADVGAHVILAPSMTGVPLKELPPGQGHLPAEAASLPSPRLVIGSGGGAMAVKAVAAASLEPSGQAAMTGMALSEDPFLNEGGGSVEKKDIDYAIKARSGAFQACYQRELQRQPGLAGKVVARFVINTDGTVKAAMIGASTLPSAPVQDCVIKEIRGTTFTPPTGGGTVVVTYPFAFGA
jgi:TonB family protein